MMLSPRPTTSAVIEVEDLNPTTSAHSTPLYQDWDSLSDSDGDDDLQELRQIAAAVEDMNNRLQKSKEYGAELADKVQKTDFDIDLSTNAMLDLHYGNMPKLQELNFAHQQVHAELANLTESRDQERVMIRKEQEEFQENPYFYLVESGIYCATDTSEEKLRFVTSDWQNLKVVESVPAEHIRKDVVRCLNEIGSSSTLFGPQETGLESAGNYICLAVVVEKDTGNMIEESLKLAGHGATITDAIDETLERWEQFQLNPGTSSS